MSVGDTPFDVFMRPKTIHGWRPISVKIQPAEMPNSGKSGRGGRGELDPAGRGHLRPLRVANQREEGEEDPQGSRARSSPRNIQ